MLLEIRIFSFCEATFFHPHLSKPPHCPCIIEIFFTWPMWPFFCVKHASNFYPFWTCYPRGQHVYQDPPEFLPKNSQQAPTFRHCLLQLEDETFICEGRVQRAVLDSVVTSAFSGISQLNFALYSGRVPSEYTPCIKGLFSLIWLKIHLVTTLSGCNAPMGGSPFPSLGLLLFGNSSFTDFGRVNNLLEHYT